MKIGAGKIFVCQLLEVSNEFQNLFLRWKLRLVRFLFMPFRVALEVLEQIYYKIGAGNIFVLYFAAVSSGALILFLLIIGPGKIFFVNF